MHKFIEWLMINALSQIAVFYLVCGATYLRQNAYANDAIFIIEIYGCLIAQFQSMSQACLVN